MLNNLTALRFGHQPTATTQRTASYAQFAAHVDAVNFGARKKKTNERVSIVTRWEKALKAHKETPAGMAELYEKNGKLLPSLQRELDRDLDSLKKEVEAATNESMELSQDPTGGNDQIIRWEEAIIENPLDYSPIEVAEYEKYFSKWWVTPAKS